MKIHKGPMEITNLDKINKIEETINNSKKEIFSKIKPMSTLCGHIYCTQCLKIALRKIEKCPMCKRIIKLQCCIRLYF